MKRIMAILLAAALLAALSGCQKQEEGPRTELAKPTEDAQAAPVEEHKEPEPEYEASPVSERDFPAYGFVVPTEVVASMANFVAPFNDAPQEFVLASELTDETLVYAAAQAKNPLFELSEDGLYSSLSLTELQDGVRQMFGPDVKLSENYAEKDYSPYQIDAANGLLIRGNYGNITTHFFPWAVTREADGTHKLYLVDLMDPLYYDAAADDDLSFFELPVSADMIRDIAPEMQCNVYTIRTVSGNYCLSGFQYLNYKGVEHWIF